MYQSLEAITDIQPESAFEIQAQVSNFALAFSADKDFSEQLFLTTVFIARFHLSRELSSKLLN
jgi:hypothetical protein